MTESESNVMKKNSTLAVIALVLLVLIYSIWRIFIEDVSSFNGTQFKPPKIMNDMVLVDENSHALPATLLKGKWSFVIFAETACDDVCEQQLNVTKQVAMLSDNTQDNVQRLLVMAHEPSDEFVQQTRDKHPDLVMAILTRPIWTIFIVQFMTAIEDIGGTPFFLISPNGLLVMGYDELIPVEEVSEDLLQWMNN